MPHLATALPVEDDLRAVVACDRRMRRKVSALQPRCRRRRHEPARVHRGRASRRSIDYRFGFDRGPRMSRAAPGRLQHAEPTTTAFAWTEARASANEGCHLHQSVATRRCWSGGPRRTAAGRHRTLRRRSRRHDSLHVTWDHGWELRRNARTGPGPCPPGSTTSRGTAPSPDLGARRPFSSVRHRGPSSVGTGRVVDAGPRGPGVHRSHLG